MNIIHAVKFAYRHSWRSGRLGFFRALPSGLRVFEAQNEIKLVLFVTTWVSMTVYVLSHYKWVA